MVRDSLKIIRFCDAVIKYSIYVLVFLLPVLFLPWTSDVLDFNKQTLLVFLVFISFFGWMTKALISGKITIIQNKINIAVLLVLIISLFSNIFSLDKNGSFWGWPRVSSESLLTVLSLSLLYFLISNVFTKKEIFTAAIFLVISSILSVFVGILQMLGLFLPLSFAKSTSFNTVGMVGSLGIFLAALLPLLIIFQIFLNYRQQ